MPDTPGPTPDDDRAPRTPSAAEPATPLAPGDAAPAAAPPLASERAPGAAPSAAGKEPKEGWRSRAGSAWAAARRRRWTLPVAAALVLLVTGGLGGTIGYAIGADHDGDPRGDHRDSTFVDRGERNDDGRGGADGSSDS